MARFSEKVRITGKFRCRCSFFVLPAGQLFSRFSGVVEYRVGGAWVGGSCLRRACIVIFFGRIELCAGFAASRVFFYCVGAGFGVTFPFLGLVRYSILVILKLKTFNMSMIYYIEYKKASETQFSMSSYVLSDRYKTFKKHFC